jgi:hypothetical protein
MKARVVLLALCLTSGAGAGAARADLAQAAVAGLAGTATEANVQSATAADAPLRPWLAPARWPVTVDPPVLPPAPQLAELARLAPAWAERWGREAPSIAWTEAALDLIIKYRQNPLRAARALVYVNVAVHDALAACEAQRCSASAQRVAMHVAGGLTLEHLYPAEPPGRWQAQAADAIAATAAAHGPLSDYARGWRLGLDAAEAAMQRALYDRADAEWAIDDRPPPGPGIWRAAPPLMQHNPVEAAAPRWRTWVLAHGGDVELPAPPPFGSAQYATETEEVLRVARALSAEHKRIAEEWNLDLGTVTPGGVWNKRAIALARGHRLSMRETARLMAAVNVAIFDAFVACWHAKLHYWTARPVTVIRDSIDAQFTPHIATPGHPAYPSGHAMISGGASEVLAAYAPAERAALQAAAAEAAMSRLYGGIHFRSDNDEGLAAGRRIGQRVAARAFGP